MPDTWPSSLLLVDDDETNRDALARHLRRRGYEVATCSRGEEALDLLRRQPFELVLLDIRMRGMNGFDILREIRNAHTPAGLPVITPTASGQSQDVVAALHLGTNDYVSKPIDLSVLVARIEKQFSLRQANAQVSRIFLTQLEDCLEHFFPDDILKPVAGPVPPGPSGLSALPRHRAGLGLEVEWLNATYLLRRGGSAAFLPPERRLVEAVAHVLHLRYRAVFDQTMADRLEVVNSSAEDMVAAWSLSLPAPCRSWPPGGCSAPPGSRRTRTSGSRPACSCGARRGRRAGPIGRRTCSRIQLPTVEAQELPPPLRRTELPHS